jgi:hypothetical protein
MLAAGQQLPAAAPDLSGRKRSFVIVSATAIVAVGSAILYAVIGNPDLASMPRAWRAGAVPDESGALPAWHPALEDVAAADPSSADAKPGAALPHSPPFPDFASLDSGYEQFLQGRGVPGTDRKLVDGAATAWRGSFIPIQRA